MLGRSPDKQQSAFPWILFYKWNRKAVLSFYWMRQYLFQNHTALSTELKKLADYHGLRYPQPSEVIRAYLHYEALVLHEYDFICVECGMYPPVLITDADKKCCFRLKGIHWILFFKIVAVMYWKCCLEWFWVNKAVFLLANTWSLSVFPSLWVLP